MSQHTTTSFVRNLGIVTILAAIYDLVIVIFYFTQVAHFGAAQRNPQALKTFSTFNAFTLSTNLILLIIYLRHTIKNSQLDYNGKVLWIASLVLLSPLSMVAYWYSRLRISQPVSKITRQ